MKETKYLIVGQGLAGTLLSYFFEKEKKDFLIFTSPNKKPSSFVSAGMFNAIGGKRFLKTWLADELLEFAKTTYKNIEKDLNLNLYHEEEILNFFQNQDEKNLSLKKLEEKENSTYLKLDNHKYNGIKDENGYISIKNGGWLNVPLLLQSFEKYFQNKLIYEDINFQELKYKNEKWIYKDYSFDKIIFCEGYHAINNPFFKEIKFLLCKGQVISIKDNKKILDRNKVFKKGIYLVNTEENIYKVGATYEWNDLTEEITEKGINDLTNKLKNFLDIDYEIIKKEVGIRPTVSDKKPILGEHPNYKNIYIFNGLGTKGVMLSPYFAKQIFDFIINEKPILKEVDINRFF